MFETPIHALAKAMRQHPLVRFIEQLDHDFAQSHLKELVIDSMGPNREMKVDGRVVINFGSDSFLGLDQDPRVQSAICRGMQKWGTHNGAARPFSLVRANEESEARLAAWLGTEAVLIYPSVTLANLGALPGLVSRGDVLVVDDQAHNSIHEAAKIAKSNKVRLLFFRHSDPVQLERILTEAAPYRVAVVAIDGVYSMTGALAPLAQLNQVAMKHRAVLYVDDAHGTGVLGNRGRGTVLDALGSYANTFVAGSLSKALSCFGGFVGCPAEFKQLLKIRSNTFIFGGPVPPPYLEAICAACAIIDSPEYDEIQARLQCNYRRLVDGARSLGLAVMGGQTPIISIPAGSEEQTFAAGHFLFQRGFYVQSVTFPAVPFVSGGILRIQVNANHRPESIDQLLEALSDLKKEKALPEVDRKEALAST
jgi:glycine C-acetyltransferase